MPLINRWMNSMILNRNYINDIEQDNRAYNYTDRVIQDKPAIIIVWRVGQELPLLPQLVRIETTRIQPDKDVGRSGREVNSNAILIGYKNHPDVPNTDLKVGDRFAFDNVRFEVRLIYWDLPGRLEAWLEVVE